MSSDNQSIAVGVKLTPCTFVQDSVLTHAREAAKNRELAYTIEQDSAKMVGIIQSHPELFLTLAGEGSTKDTYNLKRALAVLHKNAPVRTQVEIKSLTGVKRGISQGLTVAKLHACAVAVRAVADERGITAKQLVSEWKTLDDATGVLGITHEAMRQSAQVERSQIEICGRTSPSRQEHLDSCSCICALD